MSNSDYRYVMYFDSVGWDRIVEYSNDFEELKYKGISQLRQGYTCIIVDKLTDKVFNVKLDAV